MALQNKKNSKKSKKRLATVQDPTLEAIVEGMFRFASESQAVSLMQRLSEQFQIAKDQDPVKLGECPSLTLWIRDYSVSKDEEAKGYKGNFARISVKKVAADKMTLVAEKVSLPINKHPASERPKRRHPNNGHPVIRAAQRNKVYPNIEQLRTELLKLHEEFPETSIPGRDKLHLLIYSRQVKPPIQKVTLKIVPVPEKGYKFELSENIKKEPTPIPKVAQAEAADKPAAPMVDGKFTSLVALQRKKKPVKPTSGGKK
jgi:hypothetical protein